MFLKEALESIGLEKSDIQSLDIVHQSHYSILKKHNIGINTVNLFDKSYTKLSRTKVITEYIQQQGTTLVLCDGGNKITEFNTIAPLIKSGDFIMAHDYISTQENFENNFKNKIWNWCEIEDKDISNISKQENLVPYNQEAFSKVVWVCKTKK